MEWLSGWLRSIVLVILLAAFIDLILPSHTMQRYVKTVISLFILLTLLNPVFTLLQDKWNPDRMLAEASAAQERLAAGKPPDVPSLEAIERQSAQLKELQSRQSRRLAEAQVAEKMKESIRRQTGLAVTSVRVNSVTDEKGQAAIGSVAVAVQAQDSGKPAGGTGQKDIAIRPVQPVSIQIQPSPAADAAAGAVRTEPAPLEERSKAAVLNALRQEWLLTPEQVNISVETR